MTYYADLHIHTTFSDGTMKPYEIIKEASKKKISIVSITDHDSVLGVDEASIVGNQIGVTVIPGVELSTDYDKNLHVLGYFVDNKSIDILNYSRLIKEKESLWVIKTLNKLRKLNVEIEIGQVINKKNRINDESIAAEMVKKQYTKTVREAQEKYFEKGMPAYIELFRYSPQQCIQLIKTAKGLAILAHPMRLSKNPDDVLKIVKTLMDSGLDGIECFHPSNSIESTKELITFCNKNDLCITGGSDFHGLYRDIALGEFGISIDDFNRLLKFHNYA